MSEPQRTGPEWLRFEAWRLDLHKGTMAQETMADKLRKYADAWEEQVTQLEAEVEGVARQGKARHRRVWLSR